MAIVWEVRGIKAIDDNNFGIRIARVVDGTVQFTIDKIFPKSITQQEAKNQLVQLVRQHLAQAQADQVPFQTLDLSDFEQLVRAP